MKPCTEPEFEGFSLFYLMTKPSDERMLNRTPLTVTAPEPQ